MQIKIIICFFYALMFSNLVKADVYSCQEEGVHSYSDSPKCKNAKKIETKPDQIRATASLLYTDKFKEPRYVINGEVNSKKMQLVVDTGATLTSLPRDLAIEAGIDSRCKKATFETASGNAEGCITSAKEITIGDIKIKNVEIAVIDKLQTPLLGMNTISRMKINYIDENKISFAKKD